MIRTPLRPLARILRAREKGENPDAIEAENRAQRHAEIQESARNNARHRLVFMAMSFVLAFGAVGVNMGVLAASQPTEPRVQSGSAQIMSQRADITDRYGRVVADCIVGRENLNRWMVREGWAVAYRQYSTAYIPAEDHARTGQRGIWQGRFDMPWDWRAERRSGQNAAPTMSRLYELAGQNWSCSPRRTCSQIGSCAEARWYLQNCPWGGKLDRDNDGIPCESIC